MVNIENLTTAEMIAECEKFVNKLDELYKNGEVDRKSGYYYGGENYICTYTGNGVEAEGFDKIVVDNSTLASVDSVWFYIKGREECSVIVTWYKVSDSSDFYWLTIDKDGECVRYGANNEKSVWPSITQKVK